MKPRTSAWSRQGRLSGDRRRRRSCSSASGSYLRLIDSCITQLKAQGPSRTSNESEEEEEEGLGSGVWSSGFRV